MSPVLERRIELRSNAGAGVVVEIPRTCIRCRAGARYRSIVAGLIDSSSSIVCAVANDWSRSPAACRSRQLRPGQWSSGGQAPHARRRDYLIKDSAPISLRCFLVCSPEFVRDVPSRSHRNLAFHWASFALKVVEAPAPPTRSKNVRHVGFLTTG